MEKKKLNPQNPAEAVEIIDVMTYSNETLKLTRREGDVFFAAIQTLKAFVELHNKEKKPTDFQKS